MQPCLGFRSAVRAGCLIPYEDRYKSSAYPLSISRVASKTRQHASGLVVWEFLGNPTEQRDDSSPYGPIIETRISRLGMEGDWHYKL